MSTQFTNRQWRLPNAWNGTESNVNKQSNYSLSFDSSQYINIDTSQTLAPNTGDFTFSGWFYRDSSLTGNPVYFEKGAAYPGNGILVRDSGATGLIEVYYNGFGGIQFSNLTSYNTSNAWHHIALVYSESGNTLTAYVDGNSEQKSATTTLNVTDSIFIIGKRQNNTSYWLGKIDAVSIFNYALTDGTGGTVNQIAALYGSSSTGIGNPMSLSPKPVFYAPLGDQDAFNGSNYLVPNSSLKDYVFNFSGLQNIDCANNSSLTPTSAISISLWVKTSDTGNWRGLIDKWNGGSSTGYMIDLGPSGSNQGKARFSISDQTSVVTTVAINDGAWHHIVVTCDNTDGFIYLDGVQNSTGSLTMTGITNSHNLIIASDNSSTSGFNGEISNVQLFNTALLATGSNSVETLYNNGSPLTSMTGFTSLQGWWKLDASATYDGSNWSIPDSSSNSNDGTSSGMTQANLVQSDLSFTSGYSPFALNFDAASSDYIDCGNDSSLQITSDLSISAWFKIDNSSPNSYFNIITKWISGNAAWSSYVAKSTGILSFWISTNGSTQIQINSNTNVNDGNWHHFTGINDGTNIKLYIDGNLENTGTGGTIYNSTQNVLIGKTNQNSFLFSGSISNVSIWNTALTSTQVSEIYNEGVPSNLNNHSAYSNLVSWWQLGSNSSFNTNWTVLDEKGSNNGTSSNMGEDAIVDGVGSYANGLSSGMSDNIVGDAFGSSANSLSYNMDVLDRSTDVPN